MKNKKFILIVSIIILALVLFVVGYILGKGSNTNYQPTKSQDSNNQATSSNKLFDFFDSFVYSRDMGTALIDFMYPEQHLLLINYPTSQETATYAVYDYKNDLLYKNIGDSGYGGGTKPMAFVGTDKLLMYKNIEDKPSSIFIQDFNNRVIKTLATDLPIYQVYPNYGRIIHIATDSKMSTQYQLDTVTLELSKYDPNEVQNEESSDEIFKNQPGAVKSITANGNDQWILAVDLLSINPSWLPGVDVTGDFFLNQNLKIRNLNVNKNTLIKNCTAQMPGYGSSFDNNSPSFINYAQDMIGKAKDDPIGFGEFGFTAYFDITGSNIDVIYEQCLP